ncbi:MAG: 4-hydroxy-tetrahydrodipicolinate reductase [Acidimicrobiales bacterium]
MRVGVLGAGGRMGATVCRALHDAADLELACAVDPRLAGSSLDEVAGLDGSGLVVEEAAGALRQADVEVAVDFTRADVAMDSLASCAGDGIHAVVGTSGLSAGDLAELEGLFGTEGGPNCILASNFAIGAVLMMRFAELAAPFMDSIEVVELHHDAKVDAPSGTAMHTAERMASARQSAGVGALPADPTRHQVLAGARGGAGPGGVRVHSVRLRGLVAHQEVLLGATGQSLTIRHDSYDRTSFMPGVLLAVRAVPDRPGLTLGIDSLLGLTGG